MTVDLATALSTRLNELERLATEARGDLEGVWTLPDPAGPSMSALDGDGYSIADRHRGPNDAQAALMAAMDPSSVLRWVTGEREVLARHRWVECMNVGCARGGWCIGCDPEADRGCDQAPRPCVEVLSCATRLGVDVTRKDSTDE